MARPRLITNEQILATTRQAVVEHGASVSLDDVAECLGVTGPALIKRFGSRKELMLGALMPPERPEFFSIFERGPDDRPIETQLLELFERMFGFFNEHMPCLMALRELGYDREMFQRWKSHTPILAMERMTEWLSVAHRRRLIGACNFETVATAMLGALSHRAFLAHMLKRRSRAIDQQRYAAELANLFTRALQTPGRPTRRTAP